MRVRGMRKGRVEALSDGIFAIAATLLVLEIKVPHAAGHSLWHDLGRLWPSYFAYVVSFLTIGIIWVNHHTLIDRITQPDRTVLFLNLLLLMFVSFIPFPTAVLAEHLRNGTAATQHVAAAFYSATMLVMGLGFFANWTYAGRARLLEGQPTGTEIRRLLVRNGSGQIGYAIALGVAFVSAAASLAICGLVAAFYVHPGRSARADG